MMEFANPSNSGLLITNIDGIGAASADINTQELSTQDGSMFNSARRTERSITMTIDYRFADDVETARQMTYKYFPIKKECQLLFKTDNRTSYITAYVESNETSMFEEFETSTISFLCPDPNFYAVSNSDTVFSTIEDLFEFEFEASLDDDENAKTIEFGDIERRTRKTVYYDGDVDVGFTMIMHAIGNVNNVKIYNLVTREEMDIDTDKLKSMTGSSLIYGDTITICTIKGQKSAYLLRDGELTSILNCIGKTPDWFQLTKGDNFYGFTADSGDEFLDFRIEHRVAYEGV